jgi:hypothetical protein
MIYGEDGRHKWLINTHGTVDNLPENALYLLFV